MLQSAMSDPTSPADYKSSAHFRLRLLKNRVAKHAVATGGIGVIVAILLIFLYLLYVVVPLAESPEMHEVAAYSLEQEAPVLYNTANSAASPVGGSECPTTRYERFASKMFAFFEKRRREAASRFSSAYLRIWG